MNGPFQRGQRIYTETRLRRRRGGGEDVVRLYGVYIGDDPNDRTRVLVRLENFSRDTTPLRSIVFAAESEPTP